ncbi:MAG: PASTA domain-containing protein, partial [Bacteroidetes bacterium]|nr:PASTA domain-containing protein [Bacteroidota bacterium]
MKKFFSYFISVSFFKQLLAAAILLVILIQALSWGLRSYTRYNQTLTVPRLEGLSFDQAQDVLKKLNLKAIASDTLSFIKDQDPFVVLAQQPVTGEKVKIGRKIYL